MAQALSKPSASGLASCLMVISAFCWQGCSAKSPPPAAQAPGGEQAMPGEGSTASSEPAYSEPAYSQPLDSPPTVSPPTGNWSASSQPADGRLAYSTLPDRGLPEMSPSDLTFEPSGEQLVAGDAGRINRQAASVEEAWSAPPNLLRQAAPAFPPSGGSAADLPGAHLGQLPAGSEHHPHLGYATVRVFYATDRLRDPLALGDFQLHGQRQTFIVLGCMAAFLFAVAWMCWLLKRYSTSGLSAVAGTAAASVTISLIAFGQTKIEKHGVVYGGDRGELTRGVCDVTVPDTHQRGQVERPSLLRFEVREDQREHVVLTSAVELTEDDFQQRLAQTLQHSPERELLVFIHGYNVDFEEAVRRTAQIAVDLPFSGVPVCYSWPSQGSLLGYSVDANNAEWTVPHLEQFLRELSAESGATSINVIAHSMGNRVLTGAVERISRTQSAGEPPPFDRLVLAAPDVDADRFRRDFAPALVQLGKQVTLYASSDDQALIASKQVHGYPRAGESGPNVVVVPGVETIDVSGIDLSLLGHSYYGDSESILRDLFDVVQGRLPAPQRASLVARQLGQQIYWQLAGIPGMAGVREPNRLR